MHLQTCNQKEQQQERHLKKVSARAECRWTVRHLSIQCVQTPRPRALCGNRMIPKPAQKDPGELTAKIML